ncbi:MAG TPA: hypothetical protein VL282_16635, partial [Tepidisphaeraceae bacterium]|nr:hypothetical protein [Tepidisphaeraceae bacterium]
RTDGGGGGASSETTGTAGIGLCDATGACAFGLAGADAGVCCIAPGTDITLPHLHFTRLPANSGFHA